jgi:hemin uptake protein HemP
MQCKQKGSLGKEIFLDVTECSHDNDYHFDINYHLKFVFQAEPMEKSNQNPAPSGSSIAIHSDLPIPCYDSQQLLSADGIAIITHQGQRYQLRQTKAGKLILTK